MNNYYKPGPATKSSVRSRIVQPYDSNGKWYIEDNVVEGSATITANNWAGGVQGGNSSESMIRAYEPFPYTPIHEQTAEAAYDLVLDFVGTNFPTRDSVDTRIIHDVRTGTATFDGTQYEVVQGFSDKTVVRGIIDSQEDVGGWPELISLDPPADSDHDGMPDAWELLQGLNPNDETDGSLETESGYTWLEVYLNELVDSYTSVASNFFQPSTFVLNQNYPNPFNPVTNIVFSLPQQGQVIQTIYDLTGRVVYQKTHGLLSAGTHQFLWNGEDAQGCSVSSGIYLYELKYNNQKQTIKMQLIR